MKTNIENALVSIVMATYNGENFLNEQVASLINQTYQSIEIIIVDDCSTDNTKTIIKQLISKHGNIKFVENEKNVGVTKTFENGIMQTSGEFIAFCDQDDIWMPNKIELLVKNIGKEDAIYHNSLLVDAHGKSLNSEFTGIMKMKSYYSGSSFLLSNSVPGHTMMVRKKFVMDILPIPHNILFDLWIGFAAAANNGIKYVDKILVHYRQHNNNVIGTNKSSNKKRKRSKNEEFEFKKYELLQLSTIPIKNQTTKKILSEMLEHFHNGWSIKRSIFFFKNYNEILASKSKSTLRKKLYCVKMFFKPNY